jgi:predicted TIM-barrel fold metal-dependent hydrolase
LLYFPELRVVAAHTGWPWVEELISLSLLYPNVYIGTTAHAPKYWDPALVQYVNTRGIGKVLWGTDWPIVEHKPSREQVEALGLKEEAKVQLLREVAIKVFKL